MAVPFSHGLGLSPDMSPEDGAKPAAAEAKALQSRDVDVPYGHGLGLSPGVASGADLG